MSSDVPRKFSVAAQVTILIIIWIWMSFASLGMRPWSSRGEPREALVAQSMVRSGNFVLGEGYGGVVPSKPPVLHWSAALLSEVFGDVSEFSMRAPSSLAALGILLCVFGISSSAFPSIPALFPALVLASSLEFFRSGIEARVDMLLSLSMFGALLALYRFIKDPKFLIGCLSTAFLAVAILAKGPVGFVLPCATITLFWWVEYRKFWRPSLIGVPLTLAVAVAGIWYWEAYQVGGVAFFERVKYENVLRFLGTQDDQPHKHSAFYLLSMLLVGLIPWVFSLRPKFSRSIEQVKNDISKWYLSQPEIGRLLIWWILTVFIFFCIPSGKRGVYLLPMYPALAILLSQHLLKVGIVWFSRISGIVFAVAAILAIALDIGVFTSYAGNGKVAEVLQQLSKLATAPSFVWVAHIALLLSGLYLCVRSRVLTHTAAAVAICVALGGIHAGYLTLGARWLSPRDFASHITTSGDLEPTARLLSYDHEFYGLSFYLNRRIYRLEDSEPNVGDVIFVHDSAREKLQKKFPARYEFVAKSLNAIDEPFNIVWVLRVAQLPQEVSDKQGV